MRRVTLAWTISTALLAAPAALAASPKLELKPAFGRALFPGAWQPLTVTVTNPADGEAVQGELVLEVESRDAPTEQYTTATAYTHKLTLPQGQGTATITFNAWLSYGSPRLNVTLRNAQGQSLASTSGDALPTKPGNLRLLAVSGSGDGAGLLELDGQELRVARINGTLHRAAPKPPPVPGEKQRKATLPTAQWVAVVPITTNQLASDAVSYDRVAMIYLGPDVGMSRISESQRAALEDFVRKGGVLVLNCQEVFTFADGFMDSPEGISYKKVGQGTIVMTNVVATRDDWVRIAQLGIAPERLSGFGTELTEAVLGGGSVEAPPFANVALFLGIYLLVIVPGQYLLLRRFDKREWAWGTTPILACGFAVVAYQFGSQGRSQQSYHNLASVIELTANQNKADVTAAIGIYSPTRAPYNVFFGSDARFASLGSGGLTIHQGENGEQSLRNFAIPQWSMRAAVAETTLTMGEGVQASLTRKGDWVAGMVVNRTGHVLTGAVLYSPSGQISLGTMVPGASEKVRFRAPLWSSAMKDGYRSGQLNTFNYDRGTMRSLLVLDSALSGSLRKREGDPDEVVLLATNQEELLPVQVNGKASPVRTNLNVVVAHLPIQ